MKCSYCGENIYHRQHVCRPELTAKLAHSQKHIKKLKIKASGLAKHVLDIEDGIARAVDSGDVIDSICHLCEHLGADFDKYCEPCSFKFKEKVNHER